MTDDVLGPVDPDERVEVSVVVRPRRPLEDVRLDRPMSREEFAASYGAATADLDAVAAFARVHGLDVVEASQARRTVVLGGRAADVADAFGVKLLRHREGDTEYRAPDKPVQLPPELKEVVQGVFGLDTHPVARRS